MTITDQCRTLYQAGDSLGCEVWARQRKRMQAAPARYRVPDLCVAQGKPPEDIFTEAPFLCGEIPSPGARRVGIQVEEI